MSRQEANPSSLGFLGGSFDPFHQGHLMILQTLKSQGWPGRLFVIPARQAPLKGEPMFSREERLEQLIRIQKNTGDLFEILTLELERASTSYTWETVKALQVQFPQADLWWIIGTDQLAQLDRWVKIDWLVKQIGFLVYPRPGYPVHIPAVSGLRWKLVEGIEVDLSSSEIRRAIEEGKDSKEHYLLPT